MGGKSSKHKEKEILYTIGMYGVRVPTNIIIDSIFDEDHGYLPDYEKMMRQTNDLVYYKRKMTENEYHKTYCEKRDGAWWLVRK